MEMKDRDSRNSEINLFGIFCCIGVLDYHILDDVLEYGMSAKAIYFAASFCVFFDGRILTGKKRTS